MLNIHRRLRKNLKRKSGIRSIRKAGFWFVDIPRTSSSSVRSELGRCFGPPYGKANLIDREHAAEQLFPDHVPAVEMRELIGERIWDKLFVFTLVRNPWDRMLSLYHYLWKRGRIPQDWDFALFVKHFLDGDTSVPAFRFRANMLRMVDFVLDREGRLLVDDIIRFEDRDIGLKRVAGRIGLSDFGHLHIQKASPNGEHYRIAYDSDTRDKVARYFQRDIDFFDYDF